MTLSRSKKNHHGNCVPFIVLNKKTGTMLHKGSLNEIATRLKITSGYASKLHISGKPYKKVYFIKRMSFNKTVTFA